MSLSLFLAKPSRHRRLGTPHLADNGIRRFFYEKFPNTRGVVREANRALAQTQTVRPESPPGQSVPYGELGMAVDYRIRYCFAITPYWELVAFGGADRHILSRDSQYGLSPTLVWCFFEELERFVGQVDPCGRALQVFQERKLNRLCFVLALFEQLFRIGPHPKNLLFSQNNMSTVAELLSIADELWIDDLCSLSNRFYDRYREHFSDPVHLNPIFEGSRDIGGADADLILNRCLLEIKTTVTPEITKTMLYQLIGYALLDYEDEYEIKKIGIYLARQATTLRWDLNELLDRLHTDTSTPPLAELRYQLKNSIHSTIRSFSLTATDKQRSGQDPGWGTRFWPEIN